MYRNASARNLCLFWHMEREMAKRVDDLGRCARLLWTPHDAKVKEALRKRVEEIQRKLEKTVGHEES